MGSSASVAKQERCSCTRPNCLSFLCGHGILRQSCFGCCAAASSKSEFYQTATTDCAAYWLPHVPGSTDIGLRLVVSSAESALSIAPIPLLTAAALLVVRSLVPPLTDSYSIRTVPTVVSMRTTKVTRQHRVPPMTNPAVAAAVAFIVATAAVVTIETTEVYVARVSPLRLLLLRGPYDKPT